MCEGGYVHGVCMHVQCVCVRCVCVHVWHARMMCGMCVCVCMVCVQVHVYAQLCMRASVHVCVSTMDEQSVTMQAAALSEVTFGLLHVYSLWSWKWCMMAALMGDTLKESSLSASSSSTCGETRDQMTLVSS